MDDQRTDRKSGEKTKSLGYLAWLLAGGLIGIAAEPNGDLWPQSIFLTLSAVAITAAWFFQKRAFGIRELLTSITMFAADLGLVILVDKLFLPAQ